MMTSLALVLASALAAGPAAAPASGAAAQAFADAHDRRGAALIQSAQDALARSDLYAARLAIDGALRSAPYGQPSP